MLSFILNVCSEPGMFFFPFLSRCFIVNLLQIFLFFENPLTRCEETLKALASFSVRDRFALSIKRHHNEGTEVWREGVEVHCGPRLTALSTCSVCFFFFFLLLYDQNVF